MTVPAGHPLSAEELRLRAEAVVAQRPPADLAHLRGQAHELQVSQIELEMQQVALAELQAQKSYIESGLRDFAQLYEQAPASYFSLRRDGRIVRANRAAAALCGSATGQLIGQPFERYIAPQEQGRWRRFINAVFDNGGRQVLEVARFNPGDATEGGLLRIEANVDQAGGLCRMLVTDLGDPAERAAARRRAFLILDTISEGVLVTDGGHRVVSVNPAFTALTGYQAEEAIGRDAVFLCDAAAAKLLAGARAAVLANDSWQGEIEQVRKDGSAFLAWLSATLMRNADGGAAQHIWVFYDISARKAAELALQRAHAELDGRVAARTADLLLANVRLQQENRERERAERALHDAERFFNTTLDALANRVVVLDEAGVIVYANLAWRSFAGMAGVGADYLRMCENLDAGTPGHGMALSGGIRAVLGDSEPDFSMEYQFGIEGATYCFQANVTRFQGAGPLRVVVAHTDISERKAMEMQLRQSQAQLRQLAAHLEAVKEDERKRIARDIHDELGQNMLALRIDISMLGARTGASYPRLHRRVGDVLDNLDTTIRSVHGIINELRPPVLELGLLAAIEWQAGDFRRRSGIGCALRVRGGDYCAALDSDVEIVLFRVVQEALSNVMRHARARHANIDLDADAARLALTVQDDGIGIGTAPRQGFGLIGMAERITALGGEFEVQRSRMGGCLLSMQIPLAQP